MKMNEHKTEEIYLMTRTLEILVFGYKVQMENNRNKVTGISSNI